MAEFVVQFVSILADILSIALIARVLVSWFNIGPDNPIYPVVSIVYQITEPILAPLRSVLPRFGMLDFSPMVAIILLFAVQKLFASLV